MSRSASTRRSVNSDAQGVDVVNLQAPEQKIQKTRGLLSDFPDAAGLGDVFDGCDGLDLPVFLLQPGLEVFLLGGVALCHQASVLEREHRRDRGPRIYPPLARLGQFIAKFLDVVSSGRRPDGYPPSHSASPLTL